MSFSFERGIAKAEGRTLKMTGVCFNPHKKNNPLRNISEWVGSGDSRSRTDDPLLAKQVL